MGVGPMFFLDTAKAEISIRFPIFPESDLVRGESAGDRFGKKEIGKRISEKNPSCWSSDPTEASGTGPIRFPISFLPK
jgi:hypothetical protein